MATVTKQITIIAERIILHNTKTSVLNTLVKKSSGVPKNRGCNWLMWKEGWKEQEACLGGW